ncbi:MAG: Mbeg1-like protein [Anaeroplasma sp.]
MKNITYFLKQFGNKSFNELPFNEIDSLILCQIGYLQLDNFAKDYDEKIYLNDIMIPQNASELSKDTISFRKNVKMINAFSNTTRYKDVFFMHYENSFCSEKLEQFFAVTFFLDNFIYISFRGTDLTIVGWHEDFTMIYLDEIPSQKRAVQYVNKIYDKYHRKMIIGGHSKGGNLAFYASLYAKPQAIDNIIKVYNFDGPGYNKHNIYESDEFRRISDRLVTMSSTMSIIAMLMYHVDNIEFLKTSSFSIFQHDAFNWHIENEYKLKRVKSNRKLSKFLSIYVENYMKITSIEERKRLIDIIFYIAKENPKSSLLDIKKHPIKYFLGMKKRKKLLCSEDLNFYKNERKKFVKALKNSLKKDESNN